MAEQRAVVTGAAGFVGAALVRRLLADGHAVTAFVRPASDLWRLAGLRGDVAIVPVDLPDPVAVEAAMRAARPSWVFSLAAHGAYSWQRQLARMVAVNVSGTINVVEAAISAGATATVHAGSSSEYGYMDHAPGEEELPRPNSAYAVTKCSATLACGWAARERDAAVTVLRLYSAYGPWEDERRLVPTLVRAALDGTLPPLADPSIARDFVYVDDVADAFVRAAERARPGAGAVYNVGSGTQTTLRQLVEVARDRFGVEQAPTWGAFPERSWDTPCWVADPSHAERDLGWTARRSLVDGLGATGAWLRARAGADAEITPTQKRS